MERRVTEFNGDVVSNRDRNGDIALGGKALDAEKVEAQFAGGASVVGYVWDGRARGWGRLCRGRLCRGRRGAGRRGD
jgi:hypothetical protein